MTPDLSRRLARALDVGQATVGERQQIVAAADTPVTSFEDLPEQVRVLVVRLEAGPPVLVEPQGGPIPGENETPDPSD